MYATNDNTIKANRERALLSCRDISQTRMSDSYDAFFNYHKGNGQGSRNIGETAVNFYLLNHAISLVNQSFPPEQELPPEYQAIYSFYHKEGGAIGVRMFHDILYMLTTMTSYTHPEPHHFEWIEEDFGSATREFIESIVNTQGKTNTWWTGAYSSNEPMLKKAKMESGSITLAQGIGALTYILDVRQRELSYAGLWRDVGKMMLQFIHGVKSLESTIDNSFTFCHCNGSFFEKGYLFQAVGNTLFEVLDVQRAGLIPQFVNEGKHSLVKNSLAKQIHTLAAPVFPEIFTGAMKWKDVKEVSRKELIFPNKYKNAWNNTMNLNGWTNGVGAGGPAKVVPKIFSPIDEDAYLGIAKSIGSSTWK